MREILNRYTLGELTAVYRREGDVVELLLVPDVKPAVSAADCLSVNLSKQGYPGPILISAVLLPLLKLRVLKLRVVPDLASAL